MKWTNVKKLNLLSETIGISSDLTGQRVVVLETVQQSSKGWDRTTPFYSLNQKSMLSFC